MDFDGFRPRNTLFEADRAGADSQLHRLRGEPRSRPEANVPTGVKAALFMGETMKKQGKQPIKPVKIH